MAQALSDVRLAAPGDEDSLVDMLQEMHRETGLGKFDPDMVHVAVQTGIARAGGVVGVIRGPEEIEATIGLFLGSSWYSREPHLFDLWSFVAESHRRTTHAKSLIQFAKWAAVELNMPLLMTLVTNEQTERKAKLFERQMPKAGSLFCFTPPEVMTAHV